MDVAPRRYSRDHAWIDPSGEVGVTARALERAPELAAVHLAELGETLRTAGRMGALESHKGLIDLYAPCDGVVLARNEDVIADPARLTRAPEETWLLRVDATPGRLLSSEEYRALGR